MSDMTEVWLRCRDGRWASREGWTFKRTPGSSCLTYSGIINLRCWKHKGTEERVADFQRPVDNSRPSSGGCLWMSDGSRDNVVITQGVDLYQ